MSESPSPIVAELFMSESPSPIVAELFMSESPSRRGIAETCCRGVTEHVMYIYLEIFFNLLSMSKVTREVRNICLSSQSSSAGHNLVLQCNLFSMSKVYDIYDFYD